jgi:hypothetical protein
MIKLNAYRSITPNGYKPSYCHSLGTEPLSHLTIGQLVDIAAQRWGDKEALVSVYQGHRITFSEARDKVTFITYNLKQCLSNSHTPNTFLISNIKKCLQVSNFHRNCVMMTERLVLTDPSTGKISGLLYAELLHSDISLCYHDLAQHYNDSVVWREIHCAILHISLVLLLIYCEYRFILQN